MLYAAGSRVKYLVDSPEQIWGYLEAGSCYEAAKRFGASKVILACLQEKMKADERIFKTFPLITAQANALHSFSGQISKKSRLALQRVTDTPSKLLRLCVPYTSSKTLKNQEYFCKYCYNRDGRGLEQVCAS